MRSRILRLLRQHEHISGQSIAAELKISRAAVWKHIQALRRGGYQIKSAPRYGYCLVSVDDLIIPEEILLDLKTMSMGQRIVYYDEVASTQDVADRLARQGAEEGLMVLAGKQNSGRGRKGRSWLSPFEGGVYLSLILRPGLRPMNVVQIPMVAGVSMVKAIREVSGLPAQIKWPNDLNIGRKKVAGILTEINCELDRVNYIILGIGINVNTKAILLTVEQNTANSLADELGREISRVALVRKFLQEFEQDYQQFLHDGLKTMLNQWKAFNNTLGSAVRISDGEGEIRGVALDLDEEGFLLVRDEVGGLHKIVCGDVSLRQG